MCEYWEQGFGGVNHSTYQHINTSTNLPATAQPKPGRQVKGAKKAQRHPLFLRKSARSARNFLLVHKLDEPQRFHADSADSADKENLESGMSLTVFLSFCVSLRDLRETLDFTQIPQKNADKRKISLKPQSQICLKCFVLFLRISARSARNFLLEHILDEPQRFHADSADSADKENLESGMSLTVFFSFCVFLRDLRETLELWGCF